MWEMSEVPAARDRQRRIFFDVESSGCGFVGLRHVYSLPHRYSYSFPFSKMLNRCDRCRLPIHITVSYISQMKWREEKKRKNEFKVDAPSAVVALMISRYRNDRMGGIMAHAIKYMPHTLAAPNTYFVINSQLASATAATAAAVAMWKQLRAKM